MNDRRRAFMAASGSALLLPGEFQRVEYIASTGEQYINTGVNYYKTTIYLDAQFLSAEGVLIGSGVSGQMTIKANSVSYNATYGIVVDANNSNSGKGCWRSGKEYGTNRFELLSNKVDGNILFNGVEYTPSPLLDTNVATTIPLYLFARNYGGSANMLSQAAVYRCTIWNKETEEMQADFIPCYRKSDGEIGLYDLVTDTFFTNAGTGSFSKGSDL